jgi:hypothetical protein
VHIGSSFDFFFYWEGDTVANKVLTAAREPFRASHEAISRCKAIRSRILKPIGFKRLARQHRSHSAQHKSEIISGFELLCSSLALL